MNVGHGAALSQKRIDQNSEPGKALQKVVQVKLKDFLGQDYADDVLPLYIVVMLAHGNQADLVADNLEAFLGQAPAQLFVQWYASKLIPPLAYRQYGVRFPLVTCLQVVPASLRIRREICSTTSRGQQICSIFFA